MQVEKEETEAEKKEVEKQETEADKSDDSDNGKDGKSSDRDEDRVKSDKDEGSGSDKDQKSSEKRDRSRDRDRRSDRDRRETSRRDRRSDRSRRDRDRDRDRRDRDRDRRDRYRSPSRSRSISRSRRSRDRGRRRRDRDRRSYRSYSRSRSRSRSRRKKKKRKKKKKKKKKRKRSSSSSSSDSEAPNVLAPNVFQQANPLLAAAAFNAGAVQTPKPSLEQILAKVHALTNTTANPAATKPQRELYIGNLPSGIMGNQLQDFLNTTISSIGMNAQPGNPIVSTWVSQDGHFAFCEFRSIEETNSALLLNGLQLLGQSLRVGRPKSYQGPAAPAPTLSALNNIGGAAGLVSQNPQMAALAQLVQMSGGQLQATPGLTGASLATPALATTPATAPVIPAANAAPPDPNQNLLMAQNLQSLSETEVTDILKPFGELAQIELKKNEEGESYALFKYVDPSVSDGAMNGLTGIKIGTKQLIVKKYESCVVSLSNMTTTEDLQDDELYEELVEDINDELSKMGKIAGVKIPRPKEGVTSEDVGTIFVKYETCAGAAKAIKELRGKTYDDRRLGVKFVEPDYFAKVEA